MGTKIIAEIGINHNGNLDTAMELIDAAAEAGADYVKFQKRTPELCVPKDQWDVPRETPWGTMPYIDYKRRMEFGEREYVAIGRRCSEVGVGWFVSVWDLDSLDFANSLIGSHGLAGSSDWVKVPSAKLTDLGLLRAVVASNFGGLILSTGMSTTEEIADAIVNTSPIARRVLMHCHSAYPAPVSELNLSCIPTLANDWYLEVGYSGHEYGIAPTVWAVILGATWVERHITLDKTMWGTDHMASLDPRAFKTMVEHIRSAELALGDGVKRVWDSELPAKAKLRGS